MKSKITFLYVLLLLFVYVVNGQEKQKTTILWDVSLSMQDRDFDKETIFLEAYFKEHKQEEVTLIEFSNEIVHREGYKIVGRDWSSLKSRLSSSTYDGATSFAPFQEYDLNSDAILLFTDGMQNYSDGTPSFEGEFFVINSNSTYNQASLNLLTILNNGNYVNLQSIEGVKKESTQKYSGTVFHNNLGIADMDVSLKGSNDTRSKTDRRGFYSIAANPGDTLVFSNGYNDYQQVVGTDPNMDLWITQYGISLSEVVVTEEIKGEPNEIITGYGKENKDKVGYAVQSITEDDISDISATANNAVQGKFSGVRLGQNDDLSQITLRPSNSILGNNYGLIVLDGVPIKRSQSQTGEIFRTDFIDPKNIAKISILKGLVATNRWGSEGANGVLLITTKAATFSNVKGQKRDLALVKNNVFDGKLKVNNKTLVTPYLKELKKGGDIKEAYNIYLNQRKRYIESKSYYLDVFDFFRPSSPQIGYRILSNILEKESPSYEELRGLFLKSSKNGDYKIAYLGASRMLELYPQKVQSYLDLAMTTIRLQKYKKGADLLKGILNGSANPELDFSGIQKITGVELRNLVNRHKQELDIAKIPIAYTNNVTYNARLLFDWSHQPAEFELQFVNPQKRFFTWEHTGVALQKEIKEEIDYGFSNEQFELIGQETKGEWIINIKYVGNLNTNDETPVYIKAKLQKNFGKLNQSHEEYLIRLNEKGSEQLFFKFKID